jgi:hypothetical protein
MAFSYPADRRIAGHLPQRVKAVGQEQGLAPHAGSRQRSLGSSVASAYYNNIININGLHNIFELLQLVIILEIAVNRDLFLLVSRETIRVLRCSIDCPTLCFT